MGAPDQKNRDQSSETKEIEDWSLVENQMIVQTRKREHQDEADSQPAHLLHVHALKRAAVRGGIDFHHAERANRGKNGEKPPVVIAGSRCVFHERSRKSTVKNSERGRSRVVRCEQT